MANDRRKKRKVSTKKIIKFFIPILLICIISFNINNIKIYYYSKIYKYDTDKIKLFIKDDTIDTIKKYKHSDTIVNLIDNKKYNKKHLEEYLKIENHDDINFLDNINNLLDKGYTSNDINKIILLSNDSIKTLLNDDYISDISKFVDISYFKEDNLKRYIDYSKNKDNIEEVITYVNIGLDHDYYTNVSDINNPDDITVLVNKYNKLSNNYVPSDLEKINSKYQWYGRSNTLRHDARIAFEEMCENALKDNIYIYAGSGYRSYNTQLTLYNNYVKRDGFKEAETFSARAGYSEHQTGLSMDIANKTDFISKNNKEYDWLVNNSYKYGFILRYPEGMEKITGYMYEEWHYRYVGYDLAKELYNSKMTYEEYIAKK